MFWKVRARYLEYRLLPSERGTSGGYRGRHRELNTAECVESCHGLEERLARKGWLSNVRGRGGKVEARPGLIGA